MRPESREQFKKTLLGQASRIEAELKAFAKPDQRMRGDWDSQWPHMSADKSLNRASPDEQADEREEFEVELAQEYSLESRLAQVKRAIERMAKGGYGICLECGNEIPEARLAANPAAEYDIGHQPKE